MTQDKSGRDMSEIVGWLSSLKPLSSLLYHSLRCFRAGRAWVWCGPNAVYPSTRTSLSSVTRPAYHRSLSQLPPGLDAAALTLPAVSSDESPTFS